MAVDACGYRCGKPMTGNEVDFPHGIDGVALCSKVHLDCLVNNASRKMWDKNLLLCPSCASEGSAHSSIPLSQRFLFQIEENRCKALGGMVAGSTLIPGAFGAAATFGTGMATRESALVTTVLAAMGGHLATRLYAHWIDLINSYKNPV